MARLLCLFFFSAVTLASAPAQAQSFNEQERAEIRAVVRDYLVRNPDVLQEALDALETRVDAQRAARAQSDERDFSVGPADAPITIVEFYDYRCPYCHAALEWVNDVLATRRDVRVVFKELPILGPESHEAALAALAAKPQGRFLALHRALMGFRGDLTSARIDALARGAGVDVARMRRDMADPAIVAHIEDNIALAIDMGIRGTPGFVINGESVSGGFREANLDARLREATRTAAR